ncbi:MAG: bifunctional adenosylcobinamide kinase/adenosylcobinamide-phosphate guanylyltransferase [Clostridia bacterium]|nr:bifunctional adenosylcobinamide kinase/adenosylcobinamide-phosphate guanylyltransferase [Clostridia bacterium]
MELIIGGAYQGKLSYAIKKYSLAETDIFDLSVGEPNGVYRCFTHLEDASKRAAKQGLSAEGFVDALKPFIEDAAVISREIGCGIVPVCEEERYYRELHGKTLQLLAQRSERVTRIFCGLEERLK